MNYRAWQLKNADTAGESALLAAGYGPLLARVLACRGIAQPQAAAALLKEEPPLSDPFLLKDMDKAVARIQQAIENGETIVIFGDYDVDGVSATAILYECLTNLGAQVRCKLPTREGGGYGLNRETLQKLADKGYKLIVTVDNGISAIEEADLAAELGIELVITDHHLPAQQLPKAVAVVDPKREDDTSPFKDLCGAGVAFKLCAALEGCEDPAELLEPFGELAALGTIADVMPLVGENRTIVKEGLATLQDTLRPGLQALLENAGYAGRPVTAETVSYGLAPRLNAAGRMDTAAVALKLLLCENEEGYRNLSYMVSQAFLEGFYIKPRRHCGAPFGDQHQPSAGGTADRCRCTGKTERRPCPCSGPCNRGIRRRLAPRCNRHCGNPPDGKIRPPLHCYFD